VGSASALLRSGLTRENQPPKRKFPPRRSNTGTRTTADALKLSTHPPVAAAPARRRRSLSRPPYEGHTPPTGKGHGPAPAECLRAGPRSRCCHWGRRVFTPGRCAGSRYISSAATAQIAQETLKVFCAPVRTAAPRHRCPPLRLLVAQGGSARPLKPPLEEAGPVACVHREGLHIKVRSPIRAGACPAKVPGVVGP
jgi:hypothetical protein